MKKVILLIFVIGITLTTQAQERTITGVVTDDLGAVADISVMVKGTENGTVTDFDGNYSIQATTGDILVFTHVFYETVEKIIGKSSEINILLKESGQTYNCGGMYYSNYNRYAELGYFRSADNLFNGFSGKLSYTFYKFFNKSITPSIKYATDFDKNATLKAALKLSSFYIAKQNVYTRISYNELSVGNFENKEFELSAFTSFYKIIPNKATTLKLLIGTSEINNNWQFGYGFGVEQALFNKLTVYTDVINYKKTFHIKNGAKWSYRKFSLFMEHETIERYNNFTYGVSYRKSI